MEKAYNDALFGFRRGIQHGGLRSDYGRAQVLIDPRRLGVALVAVQRDARHQHQKQRDRYRECHNSTRQTLMLMIFRIQILPITCATMAPTMSHLPSGSAAIPCRYPGAMMSRPIMVTIGK